MKSKIEGIKLSGKIGQINLEAVLQDKIIKKY